MTPVENVRRAVDAWRRELGAWAVVLDDAAIKAAQTATFETGNRLFAILRPGSTEEVQRALVVATRHRVPIHPVSRGYNWGMGSKAPPVDGSVLLDLSRLDRVREVDDTLGIARIEPGVSFRALANTLVQRGAAHRIPVIGGPADASVVANMLMRGDRIGPAAGHFDELSDLEVVVPTGELIRTGFGRLGDNRTRALDPWGVGPALSGLFSQSNLGVVTAATVPLWRPAKAIESFGLSISGTRLSEAVDACRALVQEGALAPRCVSFWNEYKRRASLGRYPWRQMAGRTPLELVDGGVWTMTGSVHAPSQAVAKAFRELIEARARNVGEHFWWDEAPEDPTLRGTPTDANLGSVYWRSRARVQGSPDPNRDGCGLAWLCHLMPFEGDVIRQATVEVERIAAAHALEPNLSFQVSSPRAVRFFTALAWDRRVAAADENARRCHDALMQALRAQGHEPFRLGIHSLDALPPGDATHARLLATLKETLDPAGILSPGLYDAKPTR